MVRDAFSVALIVSYAQEVRCVTPRLLSAVIM